MLFFNHTEDTSLQKLVLPFPFPKGDMCTVSGESSLYPFINQSMVISTENNKDQKCDGLIIINNMLLDCKTDTKSILIPFHISVMCYRKPLLKDS